MLLHLRSTLLRDPHSKFELATVFSASASPHRSGAALRCRCGILSHPRWSADLFHFPFWGLCDTGRSLSQTFGAPCLAALRSTVKLNRRMPYARLCYKTPQPTNA